MVYLVIYQYIENLWLRNGIGHNEKKQILVEIQKT